MTAKKSKRYLPPTGPGGSGFEFGVLLPDPFQILDGRGKQVRYVHIAPEENMPLGAIPDLLLEAVNLAGNRAVKLEMIRSGGKRVD